MDHSVPTQQEMPADEEKTPKTEPKPAALPAEPFRPDRGWFFFGVSLTALFLILYETVAFQTLIFISNYMQAIMILAIALLGCALGGIAAFVLRKRASYLFYSKIALTLPAGIALSLASICFFPGIPWVYSIGVMIPFISAAMIISMTFSLAPAHKVYFYDLSGAALGALIGCVFVPLFREEGSFFLMGIIGFLIAIIFARLAGPSGNKISQYSQVIAVVIFSVFAANVFTNFANFTWMIQSSKDKYKIYNYWHRSHTFWGQKKGKNQFSPKFSRGSLVERIDIVKIKGRHNTFYNGYANDHVSPMETKHYIRDRRIPIGLVKDPDVMVVGTAAEGVTKTAKAMGNGKVVGLEINPAIVDLMLDTSLYDYSNKAYKDIELHVLDARSYLKRTDRKFNVVTMMNTHRMRNIGYAGQPEYLHTTEALNDIFDHLHDNGWIILEERNLSDEAELGILRFLQNAMYVLAARPEVTDPTRHFWVYDWYGLGLKSRGNLYSQICIKKTPIDEADLVFIDQWTADQAKRRIESKNPNHGIFNRYIPGKTTGHPFEKFILAKSPYDLYDKNVYNFEPITDDRPFPFDTRRTRPHLRAVLPPILTLTLLLGLFPVIGLLVLFRKQERPEDKKPAGFVFTGSSVAYFALLGLGYLMLEVVLIQKLAMFIGMPVLTFAVVLATMLFFSGLGSYLSRNWGLGKQLIAFLGILVIGLTLHGLLDWFVDTFIFLPVIVRALLVVVFLAPLSLLMGTPFPYGMAMTRERLGDRFGAAMFGLNGAFSALATPLALALATIYGYQQTFWVGSGIYLACCVLAMLMSFLDKSKAREESKTA